MNWLYWLDALFLIVLVTSVGWLACLAWVFDRE